MGDQIIQVSPDSTGKKLDTKQLTSQGPSSTDTVQRQVVAIGSGDGQSFLAGINSAGQLTAQVADGQIRIHDTVYVGRTAWVSEFGRLRVGMDTMLFYDSFDGSTLNHNLWVQDNVTMASALTSSFYILNSGASNTANTRSQITSVKSFLFLGEFPLYCEFKLKTPVLPQTNQTMEVGFITATGAGAPTEGCFFRWAPDGTFRCVVNAGGTETTVSTTAPTATFVHTFEILIQNRLASFIIDGGTPVTVNFSTAAPSAWSTQSCPFMARVVNGATAPASQPQLSISEVNVSQVDIQSGREWNEQLAIGMGRASWQKPTFATDWAQTANWSNTAQATGAALSNTAAPSGFGSALGGEFALQQPAGSATDLIVFAYQVPASRTLVIRRIQLSPLIVTGAAGGTGAVQMFWGAGFGASAVSLATAESPPTTWSPRRIPLGVMTLPTAAAIGTMTTPNVPIDLDLNGGPGVVEGGRFLHVFVKILGGAATATSIWRGTCLINGTFE